MSQQQYSSLVPFTHQTMGRGPSNAEKPMRKGPWSTLEDEKLTEFVTRLGHGRWKALRELAGLNRRGKSCRLRWMNYLRPEIKRGKFSTEEESTIIRLHSQVGNRRSTIAAHLPGRTDNEIKNFWNTRLKKKLLLTGIHPETHLVLPRDPHEDLLAQLLTVSPIQLIHDLMETIRTSTPFLALGSVVGPYPLAPPAAVEYPARANPSNSSAYGLPPAVMVNSWLSSKGDKASSGDYSGHLQGLSCGEISAGASQREGGESSLAESSTAFSIFEDLDKLMEEDMTFLKDIFD